MMFYVSNQVSLGAIPGEGDSNSDTSEYHRTATFFAP
jgi:hypothetical protein